jgi:hypothetical protein
MQRVRVTLESTSLPTESSSPSLIRFMLISRLPTTRAAIGLVFSAAHLYPVSACRPFSHTASAMSSAAPVPPKPVSTTQQPASAVNGDLSSASSKPPKQDKPKKEKKQKNNEAESNGPLEVHTQTFFQRVSPRLMYKVPCGFRCNLRRASLSTG